MPDRRPSAGLRSGAHRARPVRQDQYGRAQVWAAVIGTGTVALVACAARRLAATGPDWRPRPSAGVPVVLLHDTTLMSENLAMFLAAALLVVVPVLGPPTPWRPRRSAPSSVSWP